MMLLRGIYRMKSGHSIILKGHIIIINNQPKMRESHILYHTTVTAHSFCINQCAVENSNLETFSAIYVSIGFHTQCDRINLQDMYINSSAQYLTVNQGPHDLHVLLPTITQH